MIRYVQPLLRPPSEARSLILQATIGCSHNECAFCVGYRNKKFKARRLEELFAEIRWSGVELPFVTRVFLADGDALALGTSRLLRILEELRHSLPNLNRVSAYAGPSNLRRKTEAELQELKDAGLRLLYFGAESGQDEVLRRIRKGTTAQEMIELCLKAQAAGQSLSITVILGLGGPRLSQSHARETGALLSAIAPRYASALTLMLEPRAPAFEAVFDDPDFRELDPLEIVQECRTLLEELDSKGTTFRSNHASNYLALKGDLPQDKPRLLAEIDRVLAGERHRLRPEFLRGL
ncbi:MAG: radical SAM protein [Myxococcota bacterium]|jgi:radical SAM superfamily enzyme YgiQ (UPF0313 family)|nr:radical SAM protein [Myxococcota bacterium]